MVPCPRLTDCEVGVSASAKSATAGATTTRVAVIVWVSVPLVAVIENTYEPVGVVELVVTVMVEVPDMVTDAGLKLAFAPLGKPLALNLTVPAKPPDGLTATEYVVLDP